MAEKYRIIHALNQFFAGLGGEDKANLAPRLMPGARGPGHLLEKLFPEIEVVATLVFGDNYIVEKGERAIAEILTMLEEPFAKATNQRPKLLLAGPAFNAGRYGLGCGALCRNVEEHFAIPAVTAMFDQNPAVSEYRKRVFIAKAGADVLTMEESVKKMVRLGLKRVRHETLLPEVDDYIAQGRRQNYFAPETGARRALKMLLQKINSEPFASEYAMPSFDRVAPAPPIKDIRQARLALITSGGIVPLGNPDRIEAAHAGRFGTYPLKDLRAFNPKTHETAHGGYDPTFANQDPNRILPLDAVRELEEQGAFGSLHPYYYATVGNATPVAKAQQFGREIAKKLVADGVQAVILTST